MEGCRICECYDCSGCYDNTHYDGWYCDGYCDGDDEQTPAEKALAQANDDEDFERHPPFVHEDKKVRVKPKSPHIDLVMLRKTVENLTDHANGFKMSEGRSIGYTNYVRVMECKLDLYIKEIEAGRPAIAHFNTLNKSIIAMKKFLKKACKVKNKTVSVRR